LLVGGVGNILMVYVSCRWASAVWPACLAVRLCFRSMVMILNLSTPRTHDLRSASRCDKWRANTPLTLNKPFMKGDDWNGGYYHLSMINLNNVLVTVQYFECQLIVIVTIERIQKPAHSEAALLVEPQRPDVYVIKLFHCNWHFFKIRQCVSPFPSIVSQIWWVKLRAYPHNRAILCAIQVGCGLSRRH
jgi:hypothetical protein